MVRKGKVKFVLGVVLLSLVVSISRADISQSKARALFQSGQILSLEKIHQKASMVQSGRIIESELEKKGKRYLYEIEILDSKGVVWELKLDAKSGKLINIKED